MVPAFYQGYFYWIGRDGGDSITIFAPDGHLAMAFAEEAGHPRAIAVDTDGTVAVAWGDWDPKKGGGIDFRDSSGSVTRIIKTGLYLPHHLSGTRGSQTEWVELDLNGNLTGRWRLDQFGPQPKLAFTRDGAFFVQVDHRFYALDRASTEWRAIDTAPSGWLEGADGDALVFRDGSLGPMHLQWYRHP